MAQKAVFFDRDDTLVRDPGYIRRPEQVNLMPGVPEALIQLKKMGYLLVVVTNQSGIARGFLTEDDLEKIHQEFKRQLDSENAAIDGIYYCPYHPDGEVKGFSIESNLRKPNAGMFFQAEKELGIDLTESWMIGDSYRDIQAGQTAGCHTILVDVPGKTCEKNPTDAEPDRKAGNLKEAVDIIRMHEFNQKANSTKKAAEETSPELTTPSQRILIWLPSPLGDAVMAIPALRAFRWLYPDASITFLGPAFTRDILSPSLFYNGWINLEKSFWKNVKRLKAGHFDTAITLKNSFGSALALWLAGIHYRVGYAGEGRSVLLNDRISPVRSDNGKIEPSPMIDYYLKIAEHLGGHTNNRKTELSVRSEDTEALLEMLPQLKSPAGPLVIFVPGAAFGPSKLWPIDRYAKLADKLYDIYHATVVLSVAPVKEEIQIAEAICQRTDSNPINLGTTPLKGGQLKALYTLADLVIANDTGPRHIAIALNKDIITLFGPNNPKRTESRYEKEVQIIGIAPCAPCDKPVCKQRQHLCMESITVDRILKEASKILEAKH